MAMPTVVEIEQGRLQGWRRDWESDEMNVLGCCGGIDGAGLAGLVGLVGYYYY